MGGAPLSVRRSLNAQKMPQQLRKVTTRKQAPSSTIPAQRVKVLQNQDIVLQTRHLNFDKVRFSELAKKQPPKEGRDDYGSMRDSQVSTGQQNSQVVTNGSTQHQKQRVTDGIMTGGFNTA